MANEKQIVSVASVLETILGRAESVATATATADEGQYLVITDIVSGVVGGAFTADTKLTATGKVAPDTDKSAVTVGTYFADKWRKVVNPSMADTSFTTLKSQFQAPVITASKHGAYTGNLLDTVFAADTGEYDKYRKTHPVKPRFEAAVQVCRELKALDKGKKLPTKDIQAALDGTKKPAADRTPRERAESLHATMKTLCEGTKNKPAVLTGALWAAAFKATSAALAAMPGADPKQVKAAEAALSKLGITMTAAELRAMQAARVAPSPAKVEAVQALAALGTKAPRKRRGRK